MRERNRQIRREDRERSLAWEEKNKQREKEWEGIYIYRVLISFIIYFLLFFLRK